MMRQVVVFLLSAGFIFAADKAHEMERYRQIAGKQAVTMQDMVDLILMTRGEFEKLHGETQRFEKARAEGWIKNQQPSAVLDRGALAYAILLNYNITRGWLFRLTRLNRYALRDVQEVGIMSPRFSEAYGVSGAQLVGAVNAAEEYKVEKEEWPVRH